jgi:hypothetical protein
LFRKRLVSIALTLGLTIGGFLTLGQAFSTPAEAGPPMLHVGSRSLQVVWVQQQLGVRPTGYYGNETRAAVLRFQHWFHWYPSGMVGPATMEKLRQVAWINGLRRAAARRAPARPPATPMNIRAIQIAASQRGKPYVFGAAGPNAFDCSGYTQYVYRWLGRQLPRTTWMQYAATHIPRAQLRPGDLIFTHDLGHVGIYAGYGSMWNAPHTGAPVRLQRVYDPGYLVGRVR